MASRLLTAITAASLVLAPSAALARPAAPEPAKESAESASALHGGRGVVISSIFFIVLIMLILLIDDDEELQGPLSP